ncbi:MAG: hypothetical protein IJC71_07940 [Clostridia bacterium]|nr:hypothetical protein [Clostridia bacterium]
MKRTVSILLSLAMLLPALTACAQTENGTQSGIAGETVIQQSIQIAPDGVPAYTVIRPDGEKNDSPTVQAALNVRRVLEEKIGSAVKISTDWAGQNADMTQIAEVPEILIGMTNRPESEKMTADLKPGEYVIAVKGNKIVICGYDDRTTAQATEKFLGDYAAEDNLPAVELPGNLYVKGTADYSVSAVHNTAYTDMGDVILEAFTDTFYQRGILKGAHFWDAAEILESYIDAY